MIAKVQLWGRMIGAVSLAKRRKVAAFQYDPEFAHPESSTGHLPDL